MEPIERFYTLHASVYGWMIRLVRHEVRLERYFAKQAVLRSPLRVLDVGCGSGALIKVLSRLVDQQKLSSVEFYGFDLTESMLQMFRSWIKQRVKEPIHIQKADALTFSTTLPPDWTAFDLIVSSGMFEYLPRSRVADVFRQLYQVAKPDAAFFLFLSRRTRLNRFLLGVLWKAELYSAQEAHLLLESAGWQAVSIETFASWGMAIKAVKREE